MSKSTYGGGGGGGGGGGQLILYTVVPQWYTKTHYVKRQHNNRNAIDAA